MSDYRYTGYLETILYKPDPAGRDSVESISLGAEELIEWSTEDLDITTEWRRIPARKIKTEDGLKLEGHFQGVMGIESLSKDDPRHWVPLTTLNLTEEGLPIDTDKYPIIEVTYRCTSENAHPVWMWTYDGGSHFGALPKTQEWITVAKSIPHSGYPSRVDNIIFRLYSSSRSTESFEIKSLMFRGMTPGEKEAVERNQATLEAKIPKETAPVLDEFMPLGVYMDADTVRRLAKTLEISVDEYWDFVMEDLVTHNHNAIALAHVDDLKPDEWKSLLAKCEASGIKLVTRHEYPYSGTPEEQQQVIDSSIKPYADSEAIFCRGFSGEPIESDFQKILDAKESIEEADPNHPVSLITRYPNAYGLFAPYFQASGVGHFQTRRPWDAGKMVHSHVPLSTGKQFWVAAPTFMYPTQTPAWSTCPEMRLMLNLAIANGARGWFSYSYHNDPLWTQGRVQRTLTGPFLAFSDLWSELSHRMRYAHALAPLLLQTSIEETMDDWFVQSVSTDTQAIPAPGISPISNYHLRDNDFSLYCTVNNNVREMASVNIDIPKSAAPGMEIYDLTEYITSQNWAPLQRQKHVEMFPGQELVLLVASPERCRHWRDEMAQRMMGVDRAKLNYTLELVKQYDLECSSIEEALHQIGDHAQPENIGIVHRARSALTDLLQGDAAIAELQTNLFHARAAVCGCDGAVCRLMEKGKVDIARNLGDGIAPIAAEITQLRLELKHGHGKAHVESSASLAERALKLLEVIRYEYSV